MTKRDYERFDRLVTLCSFRLHDPAKQSMDIWRGDMRAIIAAYQELQRYSRKEDLAHDAKVMKGERAADARKARESNRCGRRGGEQA